MGIPAVQATNAFPTGQMKRPVCHWTFVLRSWLEGRIVRLGVSVKAMCVSVLLVARMASERFAFLDRAMRMVNAPKVSSLGKMARMLPAIARPETSAADWVVRA